MTGGEGVICLIIALSFLILGYALGCAEQLYKRGVL